MLIGTNGSGKTTLVRILSTELIRTSGGPTINGVVAKTLRKKIAIVLQEVGAISWMTPNQIVPTNHHRSHVHCKDSS